MTVPIIKVFGIPKALSAFEELPKRVRTRHMRIALNAGAGIVRDAARTFAPKQTGLLRRSLGVKVKIPDASFNVAHHGKPAYALIGPKRRSGRFFLRSKTGRLRGFGEANRELKATRAEAPEGQPAFQREREAVRFVRASFPKAVYRNPSRYAHLVEKGTKRSNAKPFLRLAVLAAGGLAQLKIIDKLHQGLMAEAATLARR